MNFKFFLTTATQRLYRIINNNLKMSEIINITSTTTTNDIQTTTNDIPTTSTNNTIIQTTEDDEPRKTRKQLNTERKQNRQHKKRNVKKPVSTEDKEYNKSIFTLMNTGVKDRAFRFFKEDLKCSVCWLLQANCICNKVGKFDLKHDYILCFHPNEFGRASNTGKMLLLSDNSNLIGSPPAQDFSESIYNTELNENKPIKSRMFLMGEKIDEEIFYKKLESLDRNTTFVLFPSKTSVNIKDVLKSKSITLDNHQLFKKSRNVESTETTATTDIEQELKDDETTTTDDSKENVDNGDEYSDDVTTITESIKMINLNQTDMDKLEKFTIIIADGTWGQAKSINKRIPSDITRIHLEFGDLKFKSLFNSVRSQPQVDRISTLEATILSMKSLGESESVCSTLVDSLKLMIATLIKQNNKDNIMFHKKWVGDSGFIKRNTYGGDIDNTENNDNADENTDIHGNIDDAINNNNNNNNNNNKI